MNSILLNLFHNKLRVAVVVNIDPMSRYNIIRGQSDRDGRLMFHGKNCYICHIINEA